DGGRQEEELEEPLIDTNAERAFLARSVFASPTSRCRTSAKCRGLRPQVAQPLSSVPRLLDTRPNGRGWPRPFLGLFADSSECRGDSSVRYIKVSRRHA